MADRLSQTSLARRIIAVPGLAQHAPKPTRASRVATGGGGAKSRALAPGACIMSDLSRSRRGGSPLPCPRCRTTMDEVLSIAPVAGEPGLTAYECPNCSYVTSVLQQAKDAR